MECWRCKKDIGERAKVFLPSVVGIEGHAAAVHAMCLKYVDSALTKNIWFTLKDAEKFEEEKQEANRAKL